MLVIAARRMGFHVLQWTGGDKSGAAGIADKVIVDDFDSASALDEFIEACDVATVEFENIPRSLMEAIEARGMPLMPGSNAVATCQHREREKRFLAENGIPCARFEVVESAEELERAHGAMAVDTILKTAEFGYDGKGQQMVEAEASAEALGEVWTRFGGVRAVLEEKVSLAAELSVLVARDREGNTVTYDPAENHHRNHILDVSILPARLSAKQLAQAREIAVTVAEKLDYRGLLAVEFFLTSEGKLLVNEMAPRPHNSGHHTIDACECSQFEQQARVLAGLPLGSPRLAQPAVMWNLLGDLWVDEKTPPDWSPVLSTPGAFLHLYGKSEARVGRKMGHVTFLGKTPEEAMARAGECLKAFGRELPV